jgi:hypothetical protein
MEEAGWMMPMAFKQAGGKHVSDANKESYHNAA